MRPLDSGLLSISSIPPKRCTVRFLATHRRPEVRCDSLYASFLSRQIPVIFGISTFPSMAQTLFCCHPSLSKSNDYFTPYHSHDYASQAMFRWIIFHPLSPYEVDRHVAPKHSHHLSFHLTTPSFLDWCGPQWGSSSIPLSRPWRFTWCP